MKKNITLLALALFLLPAFSFSQSLEEAKKLFQQQEFEKAKPVFQRLSKSNPNNASYNYWYGACLYETGEKDQSEKYLLVGAKKKVQEAFRYLGQLYFDQYRFEESEQNYQEYITMLTKAKKETSPFEAILEKAKMGARMLKGVEEVTVIDSFIVDKEDLLTAYKISPESGEIYKYNDYFKKTGDHPGTVYQTELKNKLYFSAENEENQLDIYTASRQLQDWSRPALLPSSINTAANENYPYVLSDGVTIYYASDGEGSLGGYDIFVTRYNTNNDTYLVPDNIGMPFNSPFNDYLYVIDEFNNLGWFVSDRFQPEDKVCVYVFIPNSSKQIYNYEAHEQDMIRRAAMLNSIEETWKDENEVKAAKQRLSLAKYHKPEQTEAHDFVFIIDDNTTYYKLDSFTSSTARQLYQQLQQKDKDLAKLAAQLDTEREKYSKASPAQRQTVSPGLLDLEKRVEQMEDEIKLLIVQVRNQEIKNLSK